MKETDWHHAPLHRFVPGTVQMITAGTYGKAMLFKGDQRLSLMRDLLLERFVEKKWLPHAWACFPNHYHILAMAPDEGDTGLVLKGLHSKLAIALNKLDGTPGRKVMYQFWDRCVSFDSSYYARLNYVMNNPVKHGIVEDAEAYPYCSARWFRRNNPSQVRRKVAAYGYARVNEPDDF